MHGPLFVIAGVLILAGIQMLAIGLLGELQVRHYYTSQQRAPYAIDRLVRLRAPEEPSMLSDRHDDSDSKSREQGTGIGNRQASPARSDSGGAFALRER